MTPQTKRLRIIGTSVTVLLLIPLIAMQLTDEVNWGLADFVIAGALLLTTGLLVELAIRKVKNPSYRTAIIAGIIVILLLMWVELAVGIFGTPFAGS